MDIVVWVVLGLSAVCPMNENLAMPLARKSILSGLVLLFFAVLFGAFGAHALNDLLIENNRLGVFETASRYHFYHGVALIILGMLMHIYNGLKFQAAIYVTFFLGVLLFSGSLYCLAILNLAWLGAIAPIGGTLLLCGWGLLIYSLSTEAYITGDETLIK